MKRKTFLKNCCFMTAAAIIGFAFTGCAKSKNDQLLDDYEKVVNDYLKATDPKEKDALMQRITEYVQKIAEVVLLLSPEQQQRVVNLHMKWSLHSMGIRN